MAVKKSLKEQKREVIEKIEKLGLFNKICISCKELQDVRQMVKIEKKDKYICQKCFKLIEEGELLKPKTTITYDKTFDFNKDFQQTPFKEYPYYGDPIKDNPYTGTTGEKQFEKTWYGSDAKLEFTEITQNYKQLQSFANGY